MFSLNIEAIEKKLMKNLNTDSKKEYEVIIQSFINSKIKNIVRKGKILCPICGKRIHNLSRKLRFINIPSDIYLFFSHLKCKEEFFEKTSTDPSLDNIKVIISNTPLIKASEKNKKEYFFEKLQEFLNQI